MPRSSLPVNAASRGWSRWRALLAGLVVAGVAAAGLAAAAPAAAEDTLVPASTLEIAVTDCDSYGGQGVLNYVVRDPNPFYRDFIWITDATNAVVHEATYLDGTEFEADVDLDPGTYTIRYSVEHETGAATIDVQTFTIGECPDLGVAVTPLACSTDRNGEALLTLTGLVPGELYVFDVQGPTFAVGGPLDEVGETEEIELVGMPPGNYYAYVELVQFDPEPEAVPPAPVFDWVGFTIDPCQPAIAVDVTECTSAGGTGAVHVALSSLVDGVEYLVWVTDQGMIDGTPYGEVQTVTGDPTGTAERGHLVATRRARLHRLGRGRVAGDSAMGGAAVPRRRELHTARVGRALDERRFTLAPCPAAPVKPASTTTLPATGLDGVGGALLAAVVLLGFGAAALLSTRRHRTRARDLS